MRGRKSRAEKVNWDKYVTLNTPYFCYTCGIPMERSSQVSYHRLHEHDVRKGRGPDESGTN